MDNDSVESTEGTNVGGIAGDEPQEFVFSDWGIGHVKQALGLPSDLITQRIVIDIKSGEFAMLYVQSGIRNEQIDRVLSSLGSIASVEGETK